MKNLIIGETSQLRYYFPENYDVISSRDIRFNEICEKQYNRIYLLFAEQRTYLNENLDFYKKINVDYTIEVINNIKNYCGEIVIYGTSELWNQYSGPININLPFNYSDSNYIKSKDIMVQEIHNKFNNVKIVHPFNFNSIYRKGDFLFGKIFDSILNKKKIIIGDININRDIVHPKVIVNESLNAKNDIIVGSGYLTNLENFIINLYGEFGCDFSEFVKINNDTKFKNFRKEYFCEKSFSTPDELKKLTCYDIRNYKVS